MLESRFSTPPLTPKGKNFPSFILWQKLLVYAAYSRDDGGLDKYSYIFGFRRPITFQKQV